MSDQVLDFFGMLYVVPRGAAIGRHHDRRQCRRGSHPDVDVALSAGHAALWVKGLIATAIVAVVLHWLAKPVPGVGIAVPIFVPAAGHGHRRLVLRRDHAAPLAYIGGSLGTLIGADLSNLDNVRGLGAPVASIGGAGTFDGIFLTGILAVLLASLFARRPNSAARMR